MANMKIFAVILLLLPLVSDVAYSRYITKRDSNLVFDGVDSDIKPAFLEWPGLATSTVTCEPIYGFLPCSTNVWGLLFLIVVYEILLSLGGQYVANGSNLFFQIVGPGVFGGSLFQVLGTIPQIVLVLGTIPQIVLVLVSSLSGTDAAAQQRVTMGMGLVAGTTVMLLTLIWAASVIVGSYDLTSVAKSTSDKCGTQKDSILQGRSNSDPSNLTLLENFKNSYSLHNARIRTKLLLNTVLESI